MLILTACGTVDGIPPTPTSKSESASLPRSSSESGALLGQNFTLKQGESLQISEGQLVVGVIEVLEDSRCPAGMECFWEGNAKVLVSVGEQEFTLTIGKLLEGDQNAVELGNGLSMRLLRLDPYPEGGEGSKDYLVTLIIEPESSQPFNYPKSI